LYRRDDFRRVSVASKRSIALSVPFKSVYERINASVYVDRAHNAPFVSNRPGAGIGAMFVLAGISVTFVTFVAVTRGEPLDVSTLVASMPNISTESNGGEP
jgi:hypothetical protein